MNKQEKQEQKNARQEWKQNMLALYPDFTTKKWGRTSYRINHPQTFQ